MKTPAESGIIPAIPSTQRFLVRDDHNALIASANRSNLTFFSPTDFEVAIKGGMKVISLLTPPSRRGSGTMDLSLFGFGLVSMEEGPTVYRVYLRESYVMGFNQFVKIPGASLSPNQNWDLTSGSVLVGGAPAARHIIYAEGTVSPLTGAIASSSVPASTFTGHTTTHWRMPLYEVFVYGSSIWYSNLHLGVVDLKSWLGP